MKDSHVRILKGLAALVLLPIALMVVTVASFELAMQTSLHYLTGHTSYSYNAKFLVVLVISFLSCFPIVKYLMSQKAAHRTRLGLTILLVLLLVMGVLAAMFNFADHDFRTSLAAHNGLHVVASLSMMLFAIRWSVGWAYPSKHLHRLKEDA